MEASTFYAIDKSFLERNKERQTLEDFHRSMSGNYEPVDYPTGSTIRFWINDKHEDYSAHWHPAIEMVIPLENTYTVVVGHESYTLSPGDIFIIPSGELHQLSAPETGSRLIYLFDISVLSRIKGYSYLSACLAQPVLISNRNCAPIFQVEAELISKMAREYFSDDNLRELTIYSHLLEFFTNYGRFRMTSEEAASYVPISSGKHKDIMDKLNIVYDYLDEHFAEDITLEKVADVAGFSKFHFSRLFKQCSGYNFYDYLCFRRIKSAETLLADPSMSITEVALQSGFSSLSTFNRTFRKVKNCTPSEYRSLYSTKMHLFY